MYNGPFVESVDLPYQYTLTRHLLTIRNLPVSVALIYYASLNSPCWLNRTSHPFLYVPYDTLNFPADTRGRATHFARTSGSANAVPVVLLPAALGGPCRSASYVLAHTSLHPSSDQRRCETNLLHPILTSNSRKPRVDR